jgi:hypothetical protein
MQQVTRIGDAIDRFPFVARGQGEAGFCVKQGDENEPGAYK